jgi:hypothetical protein
MSIVNRTILIAAAVSVLLGIIAFYMVGGRDTRTTTAIPQPQKQQAVK